MLKLSNIRIPVRIAIACLLPLLAFTGFAVKELLDKRETFSTMQHVAVVVEAAPMISKLIADLQLERGPAADSSKQRERHQRTICAVRDWQQTSL